MPRLGSADRVRLNPTRADLSLKCWGRLGKSGFPLRRNAIRRSRRAFAIVVENERYAVTRRAGGIMEIDILGSADSLTSTVTRLPEGKFSVRSGTSQIDTVILADQVLELRIRGQLFHALRKPKATDAYSRREDLGCTARLADDI